MAEYKKNGGFGGANKGYKKPFNSGPSFARPSFGGNKSSGRDFGAPKQMFDAECNDCHKMCQVPFRPNGMKPVYCSDCFKQEGGDNAPRGRFEKKEFGAPRSFAPTAPRQEDRRIDDIKRQLDTMNATLEKLVAVIEKSNHDAVLGKEVRKHMPSAKEEKEEYEDLLRRKTAKKVLKKAAKKSK